MRDEIEIIIAQTQKKVKCYSDNNKLELDDDSNDLNFRTEGTERGNGASLHWLGTFLESDNKAVVRNKEPEIAMRYAVEEMDRRITDSDFRDRFSDKESSTPESRTEESFKKALSKITQSYTRSISLVTKLGESDKGSR
jgi:hypothetical protein